MMKNKHDIRLEVNHLRQMLSYDWFLKFGRLIENRALNLEAFQKAKTIGSYIAMRFEPETRSIIQGAWRNGKVVFVPKKSNGDPNYHFARYTENDDLKAGSYNIPEPLADVFETPLNLDLIFVPGMAFSPLGVRIGHGGGVFDRLLKSFTGLKVALTFDFQVFQELKREKHDVDVDFIITEKKIYDITEFGK